MLYKSNGGQYLLANNDSPETITVWNTWHVWPFFHKTWKLYSDFFYLSLSVHILLYFVNGHKGCSFCELDLKNNKIFISQSLGLGHFRSLWTFISSIFIKPYYKIPQTLDMPCYLRFRYWTGSSYSTREIIMF